MFLVLVTRSHNRELCFINKNLMATKRCIGEGKVISLYEKFESNVPPDFELPPKCYYFK